jgi:hypothetical protein
MLQNQFHQLHKKQKPGFFEVRLFYNDGLVSTGVVNPLHNIRNNFCFKKKNSILFYSHFFAACG